MGICEAEREDPDSARSLGAIGLKRMEPASPFEGEPFEGERTAVSGLWIGGDEDVGFSRDGKRPLYSAGNWFKSLCSPACPFGATV